MTKLWQFSQSHPKPAFSEKVQSRDQGKFFKNRKKSSPRFKGLRALWRKWHYPLFSILLKCKKCRRFRRQQRLQKCPNGQVMAIFARSPKTLIFGKSAKGGLREIFQKSPKNQPLLKRLKSTLAEITLSSNQYTLKVQRLDKVFSQTAARKVPEWPSYNNFRKVTQNPPFLKQCKRGTKENFSKIAQKGALA